MAMRASREGHEDDGVAAGNRRNRAVECGEIQSVAARDGNQMRVGDLVVGDDAARVASVSEHQGHVIHDELVTADAAKTTEQLRRLEGRHRGWNRGPVR